MNTSRASLGWLLWAVAMAASAQPPSGTAAKPAANAQQEAGEPRADTSAVATPPGPGTTPPGTDLQAQAREAPAAGRAAARAPAPGRQKAPTAADRVDLGTTTVTGDHEQPKVMYVVPWKKSDIGDLSGKPMNSLLDEALAPVDRDEFKREVLYYGAVKSDVSGNGAPNKSSQGEK
jgi:hypothetical protein